MKMIIILIFMAACGSGATALPDGDRTFVAFTSTFQGFRGWTSFHDNLTAGYPADVLGPRTQYINKLPPKGSSEFPVGTVIVEARESGTMKIFAGVKRGNNFNTGGADNWEWFELAEDAVSKEVSITWRGVHPPSSDSYGGGPVADCNGCHRGCGLANDFVCSPELQLAGM